MNEIMSEEEYKKLPSLKDADSMTVAEAIHDALYDKKGRNIKVLHVEDKTVIADYFVICTGTSGTQVRSLANEVEYKLSLRGLQPISSEGRDNSSWVIVDYGSVIVHVFNRDARDFYNLDKLYSATVEVEMENLKEQQEEN